MQQCTCVTSSAFSGGVCKNCGLARPESAVPRLSLGTPLDPFDHHEDWDESLGTSGLNFPDVAPIPKPVVDIYIGRPRFFAHSVRPPSKERRSTPSRSRPGSRQEPQRPTSVSDFTKFVVGADRSFATGSTRLSTAVGSKSVASSGVSSMLSWQTLRNPANKSTKLPYSHPSETRDAPRSMDLSKLPFASSDLTRYIDRFETGKDGPATGPQSLREGRAQRSASLFLSVSDCARQLDPGPPVGAPEDPGLLVVGAQGKIHEDRRAHGGKLRTPKHGARDVNMAGVPISDPAIRGHAPFAVTNFSAQSPLPPQRPPPEQPRVAVRRISTRDSAPFRGGLGDFGEGFAERKETGGRGGQYWVLTAQADDKLRLAAKSRSGNRVARQPPSLEVHGGPQDDGSSSDYYSQVSRGAGFVGPDNVSRGGASHTSAAALSKGSSKWSQRSDSSAGTFRGARRDMPGSGYGVPTPHASSAPVHLWLTGINPDVVPSPLIRPIRKGNYGP